MSYPTQSYPDFEPKKYQPKHDWESYIKPLSEVPKQAIANMDIIFIGGGPAGLSGAIYLKQLCEKDFPDIQIGVIEKATHIGGHSVSGAVINPVAFKTLFPNLKLSELPFRKKVEAEKLFYLTKNKAFRLPLPPTMKNKNFYTASLCETLKWMSKKAEALGISIFTSCTAHQLLTQNNTIKGISTFPVGLHKEGSRLASYQEPMFIKSKLTVLTDGSCGHLSQTWMKWKNITSTNTQTYALGVKEIWEVPETNLSQIQNTIWHTMGWPLSSSCFGGSWMYPLDKNILSLGLVAGLDSPLQNLDVHNKLQQLKTHPLFTKLLHGGKCIEWGAKTIPEGGYYSIPNKLHDNGLLIAGDAAQLVNVPALKGIHYAMTSGILCAKTAFTALKKNDFSQQTIQTYDHQIKKNSCISKELYPVRNIRQCFNKNLFLGLIKSGLIFLTKGRFPTKPIQSIKSDAQKIRTHTDKNFIYSSHKKTNISKTNGVYLSGNKTRDDIPSHLKSKKDLPESLKDFYVNLCPAGVYEKKDGKLIINSPNCIDCKATDILGPKWNPREGGSGPHYTQM